MATAGTLSRSTNTSPNSVSTFMATIGSGPTTTSIGGARTRGAATGGPRVLGSNSKTKKLVGSLNTPGQCTSNANPQVPESAGHVFEMDEILPLHRPPWLRGADRDGLAHVEARARRQGCRDRGAT